MYIKADLQQEFHNDINQIINYLTFHVSNFFIDQLDPAANLGCHPYHITLVGHVKNFQQINDFCRTWTANINPIKIEVTNRLKITGRELKMIYPNHSFTNYVDKDYLHITLGIITNPEFFNQEIIISEEVMKQLKKIYYTDKIGIIN